MNAEIVCIGTELVSGKVNTNNAYISEKLLSLGIKVLRETTLPDDKRAIVSFFSEAYRKEALFRSDIIITCGGLGPTFDDLTREAISEMLGKKLVFNKEVMKSIAAHFAKRDIRMPKENEKQAYVIDGATVLPNSIGTAPGMIIENKGLKEQKQTIILLPGPPNEMKPMMKEFVIPHIKKIFERGLAKSVVLHITGLAESVVDERIRNIIETEKKLEGGEMNFTILAHTTGVDIKITVFGSDELLIDDTLKKAKQELYKILKNDIYGENEQTIESVIGELLIKKRKTLAVAESCTGGLIGHRITNVPGSSLYFKEGVVVYSNTSKERLLGVSSKTLEKFGAVSKQTVLEMAEGIKRIAQTDFGLATTGIAGPRPSSIGKPVGLVYIGLVSNKEKVIEEFNFTGSRIEIKEKISETALNVLRKNLTK